MRVLFLSGYQHPSAHRKVELLADADGIDILHLTIPPSGLSDGVHHSASGARHYESLEIPVYWPRGRIDPHRVVFRSSLTVMRTYQPDIIHCEQEQEGLMAAQVALARSIFARNAPLLLYSWQNTLRVRSLPVLAVCHYTMHAAQHILCASAGAVDVLRTQGYTGGTTVAPMFGLDTRYFHRQPEQRAAWRTQLQLQEDACLIGYIGRLVSEKGIDDLLHAAAQTHRTRLLVVGSGPEEGTLRQLAHKLGLGDRCQFQPSVPYDRVAGVLSALDLLVLPSRTTSHWKEQFGRVLVEAMACEVAVVGSDSGAIPEVIGSSGSIFPEGDRAALAAVLQELVDNPDLRQSLAQQGKAQALRRYAVTTLAAQIRHVWQTLAETEEKSHA